MDAGSKALAKLQTEPIAQILRDAGVEPHFELSAKGRRLVRFGETVSEAETELRARFLTWSSAQNGIPLKAWAWRFVEHSSK